MLALSLTFAQRIKNASYIIMFIRLAPVGILWVVVSPFSGQPNLANTWMMQVIKLSAIMRLII